MEIPERVDVNLPIRTQPRNAADGGGSNDDTIAWVIAFVFIIVMVLLVKN